MNTHDTADLCLLLLLLLLSAFFSSAETALTTVNRIRIRTLADQGRKDAAALLRLFRDPEKMLSVILVGNNIVNLYASSLATTLTMSVFGSAAVGISTGVLTLAVLVFGEVAPKTMATRNAERLALSISGIIYVLMVVLAPIVFLVNHLAYLVLRMLNVQEKGDGSKLTTEELRTIVRVGQEDGAIQQGEQEILNNVFDFRDTLTKDIMIPKIRMVCVEEEASYDALLALFRREKYTRIPVCRESPDTIVGILNVKDLLLTEADEHFRIADVMREPFFTHEYKKTAELMIEMRKNYSNLAIVLDEYGVTAGMVTMEDLLEEIVGEIRDEYDTDEDRPIRQLSKGEFMLDGDLRISELNESLKLKLASEDYESVAGLIIGLLDHLPKRGEFVDCGGVRLIVERTDKNRITKIRLQLPHQKSVVN